MIDKASRALLATTAMTGLAAGAVFLVESAHVRHAASALSMLRPRDAVLVRVGSCALLVLAAILAHATLTVTAPRRVLGPARWVVIAASLGHLVFTFAPRLHRAGTVILGAAIFAAWIAAGAKADPRRIPRRLAGIVLGAILIASAGILSWAAWNPARRRPHVLLLGVDGLSASRLSAYGYRLPTTPFLASWRGRAWFMERAFSNACCTLGSTVGVLTGNLPMRSHVVYPPQHLDGKDAFRHLPGLLRGVGYDTHQLVKLYYSDGDSAGLREAFDTINAEREQRPLWPRSGRSAMIVRETYARLFGKPVVQPHAPRTKLAPDLSDDDNLERVYTLLAGASRPTFVHVHLMATHGPVFPVFAPKFSAGQEQTRWWMDAFYDDAIRETDERIGKLMTRLEVAGVLDETVVVLYSDHGEEWTTRNRVPLVVRLPSSFTELPRAGVRDDNVALIDIAPTILRLLGVDRPGWMRDGRSLFDPPAPDRVIFAVAGVDNEPTGDGLFRMRAPGPPRYGMTAFSAIDGEHWIELVTGALEPHLGGIDGAPWKGEIAPEVDKVVGRLAVLLEDMGQPILAGDVRKLGPADRPR